jgi:hypothetical protein
MAVWSSDGSLEQLPDTIGGLVFSALDEGTGFGNWRP